MAINLGKRKRNERIDKSKSDLVSETEEDSSDAERDVQAVFRRVFEARFQPLEDNHKIHKDSKSIDLVEEQQDSETDWEGIDSEDDKETVQIIEYSDFQGGEDGDDLSKREMKAFMVIYMSNRLISFSRLTQIHPSPPNHPQPQTKIQLYPTAQPQTPTPTPKPQTSKTTSHSNVSSANRTSSTPPPPRSPHTRATVPKPSTYASPPSAPRAPL